MPPRNKAAKSGSSLPSCSALPPVLDVCCGTKMMWFDKADPRALFVDKRNEAFRPTGVKFADKDVHVAPDVQADFKALPFPDASFSLVVFDPPHVVRESLLGNVTKYYGALPTDWKKELRGGFAECFRVLRPGGTLIFKWCESQIPIGEILALTSERPLFGHRSGKAAKTHWVTFFKPLQPYDSPMQTLCSPMMGNSLPNVEPIHPPSMTPNPTPTLQRVACGDLFSVF